MVEEDLPGTAVAAVYPLPERDGGNPIERKAVYRAQVEIRSMPASLVVQIALWPDKLADWAKETGISPAVVYNMLAGVKPYHRVRTLLARRLDVPKRFLDHLIEAPRPEPLAKVPPSPPDSGGIDEAFASSSPASMEQGTHSVAPADTLSGASAVAITSRARPALRMGSRRRAFPSSTTQTSLNL